MIPQVPTIPQVFTISWTWWYSNCIFHFTNNWKSAVGVQNCN